LKPKTWLCLFDVHAPIHHKPTIAAALDFLRQNKVEGVILGGDQLDLSEISAHTAGKPLLRPPASFLAGVEQFDKSILTPIERLLASKAKRVWLTGNHEDRVRRLLEVQPELIGTMELEKLLRLAERRWETVPLGRSYTLGKLTVVHGDQIKQGVSPARNALNSYLTSVLFGHHHTPCVATRVSPVEARTQHQAVCAPIGGSTNPGYMNNKPSGWVNGVVIVEVRPDGNFNCHSCVVTDGQFSYGGVTYGKVVRDDR
jgi:predicted phosphodiesterase